MCGIAGMWDLAAESPRETLRSVAEKMAAALTHRGPDDNGHYVDEKSGVALGHRRLAILDLSPEGHQPMSSGDGRYTIIYNGEIYNFQDLRSQLELRGARFRGHSDTEVLLQAICEFGLDEAVAQLNGMFAIAVWDSTLACLHLIRDRLGEKPLYYWLSGRRFLFASELKALRASGLTLPSIDRRALASYFRHDYVPTPHTIYEGICKLPAGSILTVRRNGADLAPKAYWSVIDAARIGREHPFEGDRVEAVQRLDDLLRTVVRQQMVADVPLGAFLSGGVDSTTVVSLMQAQSSRPVRTFTIGFRESAYNEAAHAARVAQHLGTDHVELIITPQEALDVIPRLPALYDEPFADSSQIPTHLVARLARQAVTVSLSGDGGDEAFGGYTRYLLAGRVWRVLRATPAPIQKLLRGSLLAIPPSGWDAFYQALVPSRLRKRHTLLGDKLHKFADLLPVRRAEALYRRLISRWDGADSPVDPERFPPYEVVGFSELSRLDSFPEFMMLMDMLNYLPDDILVKLDRATMAVGLESRVPLVDHRVVELAWRMPLRWKLHRGVGKHILREVCSRYVPPELLERPKMGFAIPIHEWLRGPLRDWAESLLAPARLLQEGYLDAAPIQKKWSEHLSGGRNWQYHLWSVLVFQSWLEQNRTGA